MTQLSDFGELLALHKHVMTERKLPEDLKRELIFAAINEYLTFNRPTHYVKAALVLREPTSHADDRTKETRTTTGSGDTPSPAAPRKTKGRILP